MKIYVWIKQCRSAVLVYMTHSMALPVLRLIRKPITFPYTAEELKQFPEETLGKALINFLEIKKLQLLPHYAKHDIKHILLDYDTTDEGDVRLSPTLSSHQTQTLHVAYDIPASSARGRNVYRINPAFMTFVAFSYADAGLGNVTVRVPDAYNVDVGWEDMTPAPPRRTSVPAPPNSES